MSINEDIVQDKFPDQYEKGLVNIMYTYHYLVNHLNRFFKSYDITRQQYNVLRILRGQYPKPSSVNLIKSRMIDKMSDASRIIDRLSTKKLIERKTNEFDKRAVDVIVSQKGLDLLEKADKAAEGFGEYLKNLAPNEVDQLNLLLDKIRD